MIKNNQNRPYVESETLEDCKINTTYQSHPNSYNHRVSILVLHFTACDFDTSLDKLTGDDPEHRVSAHYLVADKVAGKAESYIYKLVDEENRAWHAGLGSWGSVQDVNRASIGIEIVNLDGNMYPYPSEQIKAVIKLAKAILDKYRIDPHNVIGHSDLAPDRKNDPGTHFPWETLYNHGVGAWPDAADVEHYMTVAIPPLATIMQQFVDYGYGSSFTDPELGKFPMVVSAFQRHFRPDRVDGIVDQQTYAILRALLKKYKNSH